MNGLSVSVIIPAYNEAQTVGVLIKQISNQYPDYEVIVVNDGSKDATAAVAKEAGAIVYSHPYNIGNGAAIKTGIRIASGEILFFMDAGVRLLQNQDVSRLCENEGVSMSFCDYTTQKNGISKEGICEDMKISNLDRLDSLNLTARTLTEKGLTFIAAKNLHSY